MQRDTCYYDGACGMCRRSSVWLRRLDWLDRLSLVDIAGLSPSDPALPAIARLAGAEPTPPLDPREVAGLMRGMPMQTRDGRWLVGFPTLRRALLHTPLGCVLALLWYVPGISHVAAGMYKRVAANRSRDACEIDPRAGSTAFSTHAGSA